MESIEPIESIKTINVTIKRADNSEHPTVLSSSDTILVLKSQALSQSQALALSQSQALSQSRAPAIVWLYNDTVLADDKTLSDYSVPEGGTIIEITRRRGSMLSIRGNTIALGRIKPVSPDNDMPEIQVNTITQGCIKPVSPNKDKKDKKDKKVINNLGLF
jgi:hypothetical protein